FSSHSPSILPTSARTPISHQSVPLVYVPLESVPSKYYGENEHQLSTVFAHSEQHPPSNVLPCKPPPSFREVYFEAPQKTPHFAHSEKHHPSNVLPCKLPPSFRESVPLVYVPLESVASKYYGESERQLSTVFVLANQLHPGGAIVFLDEVDALATARDSDMHEATRRVLSVLLRE
ncbi:unnamed protein product, partial [Closterium sp. NIES-53]